MCAVIPIASARHHNSQEIEELPMELKKITAIVRAEQLEEVENRLKGPDVPGMTVDHVKGYGEYANFFARDWMSRHVRIEIIADEPKARQIIDGIVEVVHTGTRGDGIVYTTPVEQLYRIRDRHKIRSARPQCPRCRASVRLRRRKQRESASSRRAR
jgi:nitrogen regulatory protein P-II 1